MDFRTTCSSRPGQRSGATLVEMLFGMLVTLIVIGVMGSFAVYTVRSMAALYNWIDIEHANRTAVNEFARDIRGVKQVTACSSNSISFETAAGSTLALKYDPSAHTLSREENGVSQVMVNNCEDVSFVLQQRNLIEGTSDFYPTTNLAEAKVIEVAWKGYRTILGLKANVSAGQSVKVIIRSDP